jgi:hypothetical protein
MLLADIATRPFGHDPAQRASSSSNGRGFALVAERVKMLTVAPA